MDHFVENLNFSLVYKYKALTYWKKLLPKKISNIKDELKLKLKLKWLSGEDARVSVEYFQNNQGILKDVIQVDNTKCDYYFKFPRMSSLKNCVYSIKIQIEGTNDSYSLIELKRIKIQARANKRIRAKKTIVTTPKVAEKKQIVEKKINLEASTASIKYEIVSSSLNNKNNTGIISTSYCEDHPIFFMNKRKCNNIIYMNPNSFINENTIFEWCRENQISFLFIQNDTIDFTKENMEVLFNEGVEKIIFFNDNKESSSSKTSIVVLNWNTYELLKVCIESIVKYTNVPYELIVLDQGSKDKSVSYLLSCPNIQIKIFSKSNDGFAKGNNFAADLSIGNYICFINSDTEVENLWLERMLKVFRKDGAVAAVGPLSNNATQDQQNLKKENSVTFVKNLSGFCLLLKKNIFKKLSGWDENFKIGLCEDLDLCKRIVEMKYKLAICQNVFIRHELNKTFEKNIPNMHEIWRHNMLTYNHKWRKKTFNLQMQEHYFDPEASRVLISVLMTTFNRPDLLKKAISSVLKQTLADFNLVIVNDGGEDVTEVIRSFQDSRIKYISVKKNVGKAKCLNVAIKNSNSQYIAYLDDDDEYMPNHLETLHNALAGNPEYRAVHNHTIECFVYKNGDEYEEFYRTERVPGRQATRQVLRDINIISSPTILHHRSVFERVGLFDEVLKTMLEDWDMWRRIAQLGDILYVNCATTICYKRLKAIPKEIIETEEDIHKYIYNKYLCPEHMMAQFFAENDKYKQILDYIQSKKIVKM